MARGEDATNSFVMVGGDGADSYSQNSNYQKSLLDATTEKIHQVISTSLDLKNPHFDLSSKPFTIADFGCATGPNTFIAVQNIIEAVNAKNKKENEPNPKHPEFLVFFNDHSNNDFNTLFKTLPQDRQYFAVGVPGSFYDQVLPKSSLHIGHCNYTLHLLSRIPKEIESPDSPLLNKDIHCTGFVKEVAEAYLGQFMADMDTFLNARAQEVVPGGLLLLLGSCLPDDVVMSETMKGKLLDCLGSCLYDLAESGKIIKTKVESFNLPIYFAHVSEFKQVINQNGNFSIEIIERVRHGNEEFPLDVKFLKSSLKAAFGVVLAEQFGEKARDDAVERFGEKITERLPEFTNAKNGMQFFIVLRRN